jgi:hypothetical protein
MTLTVDEFIASAKKVSMSESLKASDAFNFDRNNIAARRTFILFEVQSLMKTMVNINNGTSGLDEETKAKVPLMLATYKAALAKCL